MTRRLIRYRRIPSLALESVNVPVYLDTRVNPDHGEYQSLPKLCIRVAPQDDATLYTTLVHEALHCIADQHGINLGERTIRCLELGVVSLIAKNPKLIAGIQRWHS